MVEVKRTVSPSSFGLLPRVTCPHCWEIFPPDEILWTSEHSDLLGDPRLGPEQQQRFRPTRFNVAGDALDAKGFACHHLACPHCHLPVPHSMLEMEPLFVSIIGAPACGKSYFLATMTWKLRKVLASQFAASFSDLDTVSNRSLNEYEDLLFLNSEKDKLVAIRKTELQGELYDTVGYGQQTVSYPRPFLFALQALDRHPNYTANRRLARALCLYDNAGEHFLPGQDTTSSPVTRHLAQSSFLLFLFDPTQDPRFRSRCKHRVDEPQLAAHTRTSRQEAILLELAARVRRYTGLRQDAKHNRPLIVVLTKYDVWSHMLEPSDFHDPWRAVKDGSLAGIEVEKVEQQSHRARSLMLQLCPEIVAAAEGFARTVIYVPVSALGRSPEPDPKTGLLGIRPRDIRPVWVSVPFLYSLSRWMPGLIPTLRRKPKSAAGGPQAGGAA